MKRLLWLAVALALVSLSDGCSRRRSGQTPDSTGKERDGAVAASDSAAEAGGRRHPPRRQFAGFSSDSLPPPAEPEEWVKELELYVPRSERKVTAVVQEEGRFAKAIEKADIIEGLRQSARDNPDSPFALTDEEIDALAARDELIIE